MHPAPPESPDLPDLPEPSDHLFPRPGAATPVALNRRAFLQTSTTAAAALSLTLPRTARARQPESRLAPTRKARNVIFMVADGMSTGTLTLADMARHHRDQRASNWVSLWRRTEKGVGALGSGGVRRASATTFSADSLVTDSAAGGAAWGCGVHINNGALNISPDGRQHLPILIHAAQSGKATGLVTTTRVTHATPASFIANIPLRDLEDDIARQILDRRVNVVLGGGSKHFPAELLAAHADLTIVRDREALLAAPKRADGRLLGLFAKGHVPYELDRAPTVPTLAEMMRTALSHLSQNTDGFVLQVEGGRVDHAAHNNDAAALISEQLAFDDAIGEAIAFLDGRDDTLLIITTDHANANPGLTLYGKRGREGFGRLLEAKHSFEWMQARLPNTHDKAETAAAMPAIIHEATGIELDASAKTLLASVVRGERVMPFGAANNTTSVLGALLADSFGVAFLSPNHTADVVEVTALGPGAELLQPQIDNIDLHALMVSALALAPGRPLPGMDELVPMRKQTEPD